MREQTRIEYRGFGAGHVFVALLAGAAAGAVWAYFTAPRSGAESRRRLRSVSNDARDTVTHLPQALRKATEAAKDAFQQALDEGM